MLLTNWCSIVFWPHICRTQVSCCKLLFGLSNLKYFFIRLVLCRQPCLVRCRVKVPGWEGRTLILVRYFSLKSNLSLWNFLIDDGIAVLNMHYRHLFFYQLEKTIIIWNLRLVVWWASFGYQFIHIVLEYTNFLIFICNFVGGSSTWRLLDLATCIIIQQNSYEKLKMLKTSLATSQFSY